MYQNLDENVFSTSNGSLWSPAMWWLQIWMDIWTKIRVLTQGGRCSPTHRVHVLSRWGWEGRIGRSVHRPRLSLPHAHPLPQSSSGRAGPEDTACLQKFKFNWTDFFFALYTVFSVSSIIGRAKSYSYERKMKKYLPLSVFWAVSLPFWQILHAVTDMFSLEDIQILICIVMLEMLLQKCIGASLHIWMIDRVGGWVGGWSYWTPADVIITSPAS